VEDISFFQYFLLRASGREYQGMFREIHVIPVLLFEVYSGYIGIASRAYDFLNGFPPRSYNCFSSRPWLLGFGRIRYLLSVFLRFEYSRLYLRCQGSSVVQYVMYVCTYRRRRGANSRGGSHVIS